MAGVEESSPYREALISLILSINQVVPIRMEDQILMVISLDTEQKIIKFNNWVKSRLTGENELDATEAEIIRAAVMIGKGKM
jgi:hypothetical protein